MLEGLDTHGDVELFLHDAELRFPVFPSTYERDEGLLGTTYDIDGVVVEVKYLEGIVPYLPLLNFTPPTIQNVKKHFHLLKKHVPLAGKGKRWLDAFHQVRGVTLGMVTGGYFLNLTVVPREGTEHLHLFEAGVAPVFALKSIQKVRDYFVHSLTTLTGTDLARESIVKNSLSNPSKFNVLDDDQEFILNLLGKAAREAEPDSAKFMWTLTRFGQKREWPLFLHGLAAPENTTAVSVHVACTLSAKPGSGVHVLWSSSGLEGWIGDRGEMFPALSVSEAANYQSNLDGRPMDIGRDLLGFVMGGQVVAGNLTFLQLYTNSPHTHLPRVYKHPVSGCVATCGMLHQNLDTAMYARAAEYINHMEDTRLKFSSNCPVGVRVEQVRRFEERSLPMAVEPQAFFGEASLWQELSTKSLLVPFVDIERRGIVTLVTGVMGHLVDPAEGGVCGPQVGGWLSGVVDRVPGRAGPGRAFTRETALPSRRPALPDPGDLHHPEQEPDPEAGVPGTGALERGHSRGLPASLGQLDQRCVDLYWDSAHLWSD